MTIDELLAIARAATPGPWTLNTQLGIDDSASADTVYFLTFSPDRVEALLLAMKAAKHVLRVWPEAPKRKSAAFMPWLADWLDALKELQDAVKEAEGD